MIIINDLAEKNPSVQATTVKGNRKTAKMEAQIAECLRAARLPEVQFSEDRPVSGEDFPEGGKRSILEAMERGLELLGRYSKDAGDSSISQTVARSIYAPLILGRHSLFNPVFNGRVILALKIPTSSFPLEKLNVRPSCNL